MNGDAAITLLAQRCGNRTDPEFRPLALAEMGLVQETTLEQGPLLPWFLVKDTNRLGTNLTWTAGVEYVDLPADFVGFEDDLACGVWIVDTEADPSDPDPFIELHRKPYAAMKEFSRNANDDSSDSPYAFDIIGSSLYLRPVQLVDQTIRLIYLGKDVAPADTATANLWLTNAADLLIAETGIVLATNYVVDQEIAAGFVASKNIAAARLVIKNEAMKHMMQDYTMGD